MTDQPFHNPFSSLKPLRDAMSDPDPPQEAPPDEPAEPAAAPRRVSRAVVRLERSGRGGKEVTVVDRLGLDRPELERWLKDLKGRLGCGGAVEGATLVLQGDHRKRLPALLTARGVRKVAG